jgi:hypothetical protein
VTSFLQLQQELHQLLSPSTPRSNIINCTGCGRDIYISFTDHRLIQCKKCGRKMHVLTLNPVDSNDSASNL